nr:FAD-binding oxidoreductase [Desulfobacterales bacterium]
MNLLKPSPPKTEGINCPKIFGRRRINERYAQFLEDESKLIGTSVANLYFPRNSEEVSTAIREISQREEGVVVSGGRTGITGGAVPVEVKNLISLERMVRPIRVFKDENSGEWRAWVTAGVRLADLLSSLKKQNFMVEKEKPPRELFYPVDPTETLAHLGGTVATNASGARTLYFGPTRDWVRWIKVVLADGSILELRRGEVTAEGRELRLLRTDGTETKIILPSIHMPKTKNTAGYFIKEGMDAIDLFIGSEGTLGIITEIEFKLIEMPKEFLYACVFFRSEEQVVEFVAKIKSNPTLKPLALEYFDPNSLVLLRKKRQEEGSSSNIPNLSDKTEAILYIEIAFSTEEELGEIYSGLKKLLAEVEMGMEESWAGFEYHDLEMMKLFRHALPETVNTIISHRKRKIPELHKIGTDMAVPDEHLGHILKFYRSKLEEARLEYVIFGHIGNGHLHINILPRSAEELARGFMIYKEFACEVVRLKGSVSAEHGIGRMKKDFLAIQYSREIIEQMYNIKKCFDPMGVLNPGVLFN